MLSTSTVILLRLIHIVIGVCWVGGVVFLTVFLLPTVRAIGPAGGQVMHQLMDVRKLSNFMLGGALLTILSGFTLYWNDSVGFSTQWMGSGPGRMFGLGGVLGLVTAIIGGSVNAPTGKRLSALTAEIRASGGPPSAEQAAELQRLQQKMTVASKAAAVLLLLATAAMASARYMPS